MVTGMALPLTLDDVASKYLVQSHPGRAVIVCARQHASCSCWSRSGGAGKDSGPTAAQRAAAAARYWCSSARLPHRRVAGASLYTVTAMRSPARS